MGKGASAEKVGRDIQRKTRRRFSAEEKIRIVLEGLRGEESIAALCRREGLAPNLYCRWSKEFLGDGKKRLLGDTKSEASAPEVKGLRDENDRLKHALADPGKSPRELSWQETDRTGHFNSESSVYRILKAHDLITSSACVLIRAAGRFQHPTKRPNELWQTDFTYLRVVSWGW